MAMRPDIAADTHGVEQPLARISVILVDVPMLAQTRRSLGLSDKPFQTRCRESFDSVSDFEVATDCHCISF